MTGGPDFFLGERAEYRVTDFDGRVRACYVTAGLRLLTPDAGGFQPHYLRVQVAPPFPLGESGWAEELVVSERHVGDDLTRLGDGFIFVRLYEILDSEGLSRGVIEDGAVRLQSWGQVARSPTLLPPSREERFERSGVRGVRR